MDNDNGCAGLLGFLFAVFILGPFSANYAVDSIFGRDFHWYIDLLISVFTGGTIHLVAFVCFVLRLFGAETPFL